MVYSYSDVVGMGCGRGMLEVGWWLFVPSPLHVCAFPCITCISYAQHYSGYRISTDIWKIYFLTKTEADTMNASVACSEEALDNYWNRTVTYHLSPGIEQILYGYACDRMNSSVSSPGNILATGP